MRLRRSYLFLLHYEKGKSMHSEKTNRLLIYTAGLVLVALFVWCLVKPADGFSASERRPLKSMPKLTMESIINGRFMEEFETYASDQFPMRDAFRRGKVWFAEYVLGQKDQNNIYREEKHLSKLEYPLDLKSVENAGEQFETLYQYYLKDSGGRAYLSVVPDKNLFLAEVNGYPSMDYKALVEHLRENTPDLEYIDIFPFLQLEDYYYTDPHWRQEQIVDVAENILQAMQASTRDQMEPATDRDAGQEPATDRVTLQESATDRAVVQEPEICRLDTPFYGVYAGQYGLKTESETIYYLKYPEFDQCTVTDLETNRSMPIYDMDRAEGRDPYEMFLSGSKSLIQIDNPKGPKGKRLVLFRDSFGSSIAPLFVPCYEQIILVDIRYIRGDVLQYFVDFKGADVLFLYSTLVLNNSITLQGNLHIN